MIKFQEIKTWIYICKFTFALAAASSQVAGSNGNATSAVVEATQAVNGSNANASSQAPAATAAQQTSVVAAQVTSAVPAQVTSAVAQVSPSPSGGGVVSSVVAVDGVWGSWTDSGIH